MITQKDIKKLEENFANKEELFTKLDVILGELQATRIELDVFKKSFA